MDHDLDQANHDAIMSCAGAGDAAAAATSPSPDAAPDQHHHKLSKLDRNLLDYSPTVFIVGVVLYVTAEATNVDSYHGGVSKYKVAYLSASTFFMTSALMDMYVYRKQGWKLLLSSAMLFAGGFGISSALLIEENYRQSKVLNIVSACFWVLDALGDVYFVFDPPPRADDNNDDASSSDASSSSDGWLSWLHGIIIGGFGEICGLQQGCGLSKYARWIELSGALLFVVGTSMTLVVSCLYVIQGESEHLAITALVTTMFWLLAAICYLVVDFVL
jgi:hypothetical protein